MLAVSQYNQSDKYILPDCLQIYIDCLVHKVTVRKDSLFPVFLNEIFTLEMITENSLGERSNI